MIPLLDELRDLGVELTVDGERIRWRAPNGVMSGERLAQLKAARDEIVALFAEENSEEIAEAGNESESDLSRGLAALLFIEKNGRKVILGQNGFDLELEPRLLTWPAPAFRLLVEHQDEVRALLRDPERLAELRAKAEDEAERPQELEEAIRLVTDVFPGARTGEPTGHGLIVCMSCGCTFPRRPETPAGVALQHCNGCGP